jgi:hypothetical protein
MWLADALWGLLDVLSDPPTQDEWDAAFWRVIAESWHAPYDQALEDR